MKRPGIQLVKKATKTTKKLLLLLLLMAYAPDYHGVLLASVTDLPKNNEREDKQVAHHMPHHVKCDSSMK